MQERVLAWTPVTVDPQFAEVVLLVATSELMSDVRVALAESDRAVRFIGRVDWDPPEGRWFSYAEFRRQVVPRARPPGDSRLIGRTVRGDRGPGLDDDPGQ